MRRPQAVLLTLSLINLLALAIALMAGAVWISPYHWLFGHLPHWQLTILQDIRLPRAVAGFTVGAMLGMAGTLMQVLLRNPLAEPYVLGISGGAAVAALASLMLGLGSLWVSSSAFLGALGSMLLVFLLGRTRDGMASSERLLLTGIVLAAGWGAAISFLLATGPDQSLRGMLFWLMGDLSRVTNPWWSVPVVVLALAAGSVMAPALDILARGDQQAAVLGVEVHRLRAGCYVTASILTACAVTLAGPIGFVGLVVPHFMRLLVGARHRILLPASMLAGGGLLMLADTLARTALAPQQLPVGVLTAALGVPLFLYLLRRRSRI